MFRNFNLNDSPASLNQHKGEYMARVVYRSTELTTEVPRNNADHKDRALTSSKS